jgi:hypothetical protein
MWKNVGATILVTSHVISKVLAVYETVSFIVLSFWCKSTEVCTLQSAEHLGLTSEDVGSRIRLVYTPVRKDGEEGETLAVVSDIIVDGMCDIYTFSVPNNEYIGITTSVIS